MPPETVVFVSAVILMFALFSLGLAYASWTTARRR
jgi:hypothetical protein